MALALDLARQGVYTTTPNPRVGCVFVRDGQLLAEGFHRQAGQAHAEVNAIQDAKQRQVSLKGSTAYVTLEPCAHQGRTGPCAQALIPTGVARVVVACLDPNPLVAGQGLSILQAAGIQTEVGVLKNEARWLNRGFFSRMERQRPWVRLKTASSADGVTALPNGLSQWITSPEARQDGHHLRAQACAIISGIGTVCADNPLLNVRGLHTPRQPVKVILDSRLRMPAHAQLLQTGHCLLVHANANRPSWLSSHPNAERIELLNHPYPSTKGSAQVDLLALLHTLAKRGFQEVHLEAGHTLSGAFMQAGLVDEVVQYMAPRFLGSGKGVLRLPELQTLPTSLDWALRSHELIGPDLKLVWVQNTHMNSAVST